MGRSNIIITTMDDPHRLNNLLENTMIYRSLRTSKEINSRTTVIGRFHKTVHSLILARLLVIVLVSLIVH